MLFIIVIILSISTSFVKLNDLNITNIGQVESECSHRIHKRSCTPTVNLANCSPSHVNKRYTYFLYYQYSNIILGCEGSKIESIKWKLNSLGSKGQSTKNKYKDKRTYIFEPNDVPVGQWELFITVIETGGGTAKDSCVLSFENQPPVILFENGANRLVLPGILFDIDISPTVNPGKEKLVPYYKFTCNKKEKFKICPDCPQIKENKLKIKYFANICYHHITVHVFIHNYGSTVEGIQKVLVSKFFSVKARIDCLKNCDAQGSMYSNPNAPISLKVVCIKMCLKFKKKRPRWLYIKEGIKEEDKGPNYRNFTSKQITRVDDYEIIIKPWVFSHNQRIDVVAVVRDEYKAIKTINMARSFPTIKCEINPKEGYSGITVFKIFCNTSNLVPQVPFFAVLQGDTQYSFILLESPYEEMEIITSTNEPKVTRQLLITARDTFYQELNCSVDKIILMKTELTMKDIDKMLTKINEHHENGNDQMAFQAITALIESQKSASYSQEDRTLMFTKLIKLQNKLVTDDIFFYKQVISLVTMFTKSGITTDEFKKSLSSLCTTLSNIQSSQLLKSKFAKYEEAEVAKFAKNLFECADKLLEENKSPIMLVTESKINENYSTKSINNNKPSIMFVPESDINEDYPNYDSIYINPDMEKIRSNSMNAILDSSKAIAATLVNGEKKEINLDNSQIFISIDTGINLAKKKIKVAGAEISPSTSFAKLKDKSIATLVSSYKKDILDKEETGIVTNIISIGFYNLTNETSIPIQGVEFDIVFDFKLETTNLDYFIAEVCVPSSSKKWIMQKINYFINVHRLNVMKGTKCFIKFTFMKKGEKFQVVLVKNRRPSFKDFSKQPFIVDNLFENSQKIVCPFSVDTHDSFVYLGLMPHPDMLKMSYLQTTCVKYFLYQTATACVTFNYNSYKWEYSGCKVDFVSTDTSSSSKIKCSCNHTSVFAAKHQTLSSKIDIVQHIPIRGHMIVNFIIFLHVAVVFFCYCIAILIGSFIKRHEANVHFLSDNLKNDKYAYAISIKTGKYRSSGTTSNIIIKLFGEKSSSRAHVINYPDPDRKLLQHDNTDWFILTNDLHIGDLSKISLWFDSIGFQPSWYCENMKIIDLQTDKIWYFNVEAWLDLEKNSTVQLEVEPSEYYTKKKILNFSFKKYIQFYLGMENTWNIFKISNDENLLYFQRFSIILSIIYTTYAILLLFIANPTMTSTDAFGYGSFSFYGEILYLPFISSFIASLINFPFLYIIRNSEKEEHRTVLVYEQKKFSSKIGKISSITLYLWISTCMIYLTLFGFFVTYNSIYVWIISTIFSIFLSILLMEQIYLILYHIIEDNIGKIKIRIDNTKKMINEAEKQRKFLYWHFGEVLMRPYFQKHYNILQNLEISQLKKKILLRVEMKHMFNDMCIFLVYIIFLYIICLLNTDSNLRTSNKEMVKILNGDYEEEEHTSLESIESIEDMYSYIYKTIIGITHPVHWYGNYQQLDPGIMIDFSTKILGIVQLRQQRGIQLCNSSSAIEISNISCPNDNPIFKQWKYDHGSEISGTLGELGYYSGSGFIAPLGRTLHNSHFVFDLLYNSNWIDIRTKVLFIEFWTYNANSNIFNAIKIIIERDLSGDILTSYQVFTTRFIHASLKMQIILTTSICILLVMILAFIINRITILSKKKKLYFKSMWNLHDTLIFILSVILICLYFLKIDLTGKLLDKLVVSKHNEFVKYFYLARFAEVKILISGILICFATIRLWKFLRFGTVFRHMEKTLWDSMGTLIILAFYQIITFFMFSALLYIIYGTYLEPFKNLSSTLITLCLLSLAFDSGLDIDNMGVAFNIIYALFLITSMFFLTLYAAVIIIAYEDAAIFLSNRNNMNYNFKSYLIEKSKFYGSLIRVKFRGHRLKAGQDIVSDKPLIYPKSNSARYADCVTISNNKLDIMQIIAICTIRKNMRILDKRQNLEDYDYELMAKVFTLIARHEVTDSENTNHIFFKAQHPTLEEKIKLVPDSRLIEIERILKILFSYKRDEKPIREDFIKPPVVSGASSRMEYFKLILENIVEAIDNIKIR